MNIDIPTLETPHLMLRGHRLEDFAAYFALVGDPYVKRYFSGPLSREDAWARFLRGFGYWVVLGHGSWAVEEKKTGVYAGLVSVFDAKRDVDPPLEGMAEAGWSIARRLQGKGYATEAMTAAFAWFDAHFRLKTCALIAPENKASIRVAEKTGFTFLHETMFKNHPSLVYVRPPHA
ncbi:MAG: GNAT family N-acetyltransferase [Alphaproteobacteria bacterium]|nr:GNAT family N-acetyltransferase [Alphaproteobacteria bacterium]